MCWCLRGAEVRQGSGFRTVANCIHVRSLKISSTHTLTYTRNFSSKQRELRTECYCPMRSQWNVNRPPTHTFSECLIWGREMTAASFGKRCPWDHRRLFGLFTWFILSLLRVLQNSPWEANPASFSEMSLSIRLNLLGKKRKNQSHGQKKMQKMLAFTLKPKQKYVVFNSNARLYYCYYICDTYVVYFSLIPCMAHITAISPPIDKILWTTQILQSWLCVHII